MCEEKIVLLPKTNAQDVSNGWVKVVNHCKGGTTMIIPRSSSNVAKKLDQELEEFYMTTLSGQKLAKDECIIGQSVAVLYTDTRFYRGTIVGLYSMEIIWPKFTSLIKDGQR